jgi:hypothetical protein
MRDMDARIFFALIKSFSCLLAFGVWCFAFLRIISSTSIFYLSAFYFHLYIHDPVSGQAILLFSMAYHVFPLHNMNRLPRPQVSDM